MDTQRISDLTLKFIRKDITPEERAELERWLSASEENRRRFEERVRPENMLLIHALYQEAMNDEADHKTVSNQNPSADTTRPPAAVVRMSGRRWVRVAVAAGVLAAIAGAAWYGGAFRRQPRTAVVAVRSQDLPPGGFKALLTLADGSTVVLDSARQGVVARQGGSVVNKVDEGALAYQPGSTTGPTGYNTLATPRQGMYKVVLSDGTAVWLNAASSIRFPTVFRGPVREVEITGEAYFEVKHSITTPFRVRARGRVIEDIGTRFDVNVYGDEPVMKMTLEEGAISVNGRVLSKAGEQLRVDSTSGKEWVERVNARKVVSWKDGIFDFDDADIKTVMRALSRWYWVKVEYDTSVDKALFTGQIRRDSKASEALQILSISGYRFKIQGTTIVVQ